MTFLIVFFLLFILPFIIAPFGTSYFEIPKVICAEGVILLLFLILLVTNKLSFKNDTIQMLLYGIIFFLTIVDLLFFHTNISFFGNAFRLQGIFLLWILLLFSFITRTVPDKKVPWWVFGLLLYIEFVATFFLPMNASHRYVGTLGEPNALAGSAVFLFPFGWFGLKDKSYKKIKRVLILVPVFILLYLTDSRSGMIAFGIELVWITLRRVKISMKKTLVICLLFYIISYVLPFFQKDIYENRTQVWQAALYAGFKNPFLGQGFGNTELALHRTAAKLGLPIQYYYVDSSHNLFLDWWVQGGSIGLILIITLIAFSFTRYLKRKDECKVVLLLGVITVLSFNPASIVGLLEFWWLIGKSFPSKLEKNG